MKYWFAAFVVTLGLSREGLSDASPAREGGLAEARSPYVWTATSLDNTAQLVTLTCHRCYAAQREDRDIPLLAVLRDTLGDSDAENDRLTAVWLLSYSSPGIRQRVLSAVPFFYWRVGGVSEQHGKTQLKPELDLTSLQHPMMNGLGRDVFQWMMLDQSFMPIRATSRAYRTNQLDQERLALEESITYLRAASTGGGSQALTSAEISTLIARLELRKTLLGGFVTQRGATRYAQEEAASHERVRARNWELLRQCADKTGLYFEPLDLAGTSGEYVMLWAPADGLEGENGSRLQPIWKLLNVRAPPAAELRRLEGVSGYTRDLDADGTLLPLGMSGKMQVRLVPVSAYSLNYPKMPLLLVDFRNGQHLRWHAVTQRSINEITAGVIGVSHFTNWYYFVAADFYDFVASRHGAALNQSERLDCYSQFRVALALDRQLDIRLRDQMRQRVESLAMNPLEASPEQEISASVAREQALQAAASNGALTALIDKDRRAELISYSTTPKRALFDSFLHLASFGAYTHRAPKRDEELAELDILRRMQTQLRFLDGATAQGTPPEVAVDAGRIRDSLTELQGLLPRVTAPEMRSHAAESIGRVQTLSQDKSLQSDCSLALTSMHSPALASTYGRVALAAGVANESSRERAPLKLQ